MLYICNMNKQEIGHAIKQQRKAKGLTQQQIADTCEDTRQTIISLESGTRNITIDKLIKVLDALNLTITIQ